MSLQWQNTIVSLEEGMAKTEKYQNDDLYISVTEEDAQVYLNWSGKSIDRKPALFITPILIRFKKSVWKKKKE